MSIEVRRGGTDDDDAIEALDRTVVPYRPEDEPEVHAMFERADRARASGDERWWEPPPDVGPNDWELCEAVFVAEAGEAGDSAGARRSLVGVVGALAFSPRELQSTHPLAIDWLDAGDVAELKYLRVAAGWRRRGVATRLCEAIISWAAGAGYGRMMLNTTSAQAPALALYEALGFARVGLTFIGRYELVWFERDLSEGRA